MYLAWRVCRRSYGVNRHRIQIDLQITWVGRAVVEQQYGCVVARKNCLRTRTSFLYRNCCSWASSWNPARESITSRSGSTPSISFVSFLMVVASSTLRWPLDPRAAQAGTA